MQKALIYCITLIAIHRYSLVFPFVFNTFMNWYYILTKLLKKLISHILA